MKISQKDQTVFIEFPQRDYRARGLNVDHFDRMRVNLKVSQKTCPESAEGEAYHIDTIDLYSHKMRQDFIRQARKSIVVDAENMDQELLKVLESLEDIQVQMASKGKSSFVQEMSDTDREDALSFLKRPDLMDMIVHDFQTCGYVGEEMNFLMGYLCATSRKIKKPLAVMFISRSGAGKSALQDAVLSFMPSEDCLKYTRMTQQALFYRGPDELKHKFIAIEEEQGASSAAYAVRNLLSAQGLSTSTTERDSETGRLVTKDYSVTGPTSMMISTTASQFDYETLNRFIVLTINESKEQTSKILALQREMETLKGLIQSKNKEDIIQKHQNVQRLLRPLEVVNNYSPQLTFSDERLISRRGQTQYLNIIKTVALLRQYQKPIRKIGKNGDSFEYIEVDLKDIEIANHIANETLGQSLHELPPPSRNLLAEIVKLKDHKEKNMLGDPNVLSRREIRLWTK